MLDCQVDILRHLCFDKQITDFRHAGKSIHHVYRRAEVSFSEFEVYTTNIFSVTNLIYSASQGGQHREMIQYASFSGSRLVLKTQPNSANPDSE